MASTRSDPLQALRDLLERSRDRIAAVLPATLTVARVIKVALATAARSPRLLLSSQGSFLQAVLQAAELGLEPGGALGHAYLIAVPSRASGQFECQMRPGYRGLIALARTSGEVLSIEAREVFQRDQFRFSQGLHPVLEHVPTFEENPGTLRCVYAVARLRDGGTAFEVMSMAQIERIRARLAARAGDEFDVAWKGDIVDETARWIGLGRSLVVRRLIQSLPLSAELATALTISVQHDDGDVDLVSLLEMQTQATAESTVASPSVSSAAVRITRAQHDANFEVPTTGTASPLVHKALPRTGLVVTRSGHVAVGETPTLHVAAPSAGVPEPGLRAQKSGRSRGNDLLTKLGGTVAGSSAGGVLAGRPLTLAGLAAAASTTPDAELTGTSAGAIAASETSVSETGMADADPRIDTIKGDY
jgi:recombination protein RecT